MEQLTKNQAVATSQEAVQNQNEPQLRHENAHNDKSVHGVLNPTYQAGLRRDAVQPDIEAERKKRDEIEAGKSYCSRRFGGATCDDKSARSEERFSRNAETELVCRLLLEKKKKKDIMLNFLDRTKTLLGAQKVPAGRTDEYANRLASPAYSA